MTNVPISQANLRGAVDLSSLVNSRGPASAAPVAGSQSQLVRGATDATFTSILDLSNTVPVIVEFYGGGLEPLLSRMIEQFGGRLALATVDATTNPQLAQAFQVQGVPTVAAVIGGRPVQLFEGDLPDAEVRQVFERVLELAAENNITGTVSIPEPGAEPVEEPLPPHHQEAYDAISTGDYATAIAEYKTAIAQNPRDALAIAGLAQVSLLQRVDGKAADDVRAAAAADTSSVPAALDLADLSVTLGQPDAAFDVLLDLFPSLDAEGKTLVRTRLLDYFEIVGGDNPVVVAARRRLTGLLY